MKFHPETIGLFAILMAATAVAQTNIFPTSGNVGIGTTSPQASLQVVGQILTNGGGVAMNSQTFTDSSNIVSQYGVGWADFSNGVLGPSIMLSGYGGVNLYTEGTRRLTISGGGNVGIGTTSPMFEGGGNGLEITGNGTNALLRLSDINNAAYDLDFAVNSAAGYARIQSVQSGVAYKNLSLNPGGGNVGIGTTSPMFEGGGNGLEITGNGTNALLRLSDINNAAYDLDFAVNSAAGYARIQSVQAGVAYKNLSLNPGGGNVGIGTTAPGARLEVDGNVKLTANSGAAITFQDGTTQSTAYTGVVCGGDYAESVDVTGNRKKYEPGDVLVIDPDAPGKFLKSAEPYSTAVTGIYSTKPGTVGRRQTTPKSPDEVPMAMIGIVPTKVSAENGPIRPGDLLVTSSTLGYAMKGTDRGRMLGAVIGKALGHLDKGTGVIEVVVTLQ